MQHDIKLFVMFLIDGHLLHMSDQSFDSFHRIKAFGWNIKTLDLYNHITKQLEKEFTPKLILKSNWKHIVDHLRNQKLIRFDWILTILEVNKQTHQTIVHLSLEIKIQ